MATSVLFVDDDEYLLELNSAVIRNSPKHRNIQTYKALSGIEALQLLESLNTMMEFRPVCYPKLIILDLDMPGLNGYDFLDEFQRRVRQNELLESKVVIISGGVIDVSKISTYPCVVGYALKPLSVKKLEEILRDVG